MYNRIILVGRLVADPEMRFSQGGSPVTKFTLAVQNPFKNAQGEKTTEFIDHVAFKGLAETVANNVRKGYLVLTDGRLQIRSYDDKDGIRRKVAEVICENVRFLDRGKDSGQQPRQQDNEFTDVPFNEDDIPF